MELALLYIGVWVHECTHGSEIRQTLAPVHVLDCLSERCIAIFYISTGFGAAYGTAKSGIGIAAAGILRPDLLAKSSLPIHRLLFGIFD